MPMNITLLNRFQKNGIKPETDRKPNLSTSLQAFFRISHIAHDHIVCVDRRRVSVVETKGIDVTDAALSGLQGALNALESPIQLLCRQHRPRLGPFRERIRSERPPHLSDTLMDAAESFDAYLNDLQTRPDMVDRRFYVVCEQSELPTALNLLDRINTTAVVLTEDLLRDFIMSVAVGMSPTTLPVNDGVSLETTHTHVLINGQYRRTIQLASWPRTIDPEYLQDLMQKAIPMDLAMHVQPIPQARARQMLEVQKLNMEASRLATQNRGRIESPEVQISLRDTDDLRIVVNRGTERLFYASIAVTVHAPTKRLVNEYVDEVRRYFQSKLIKVDRLRFRQATGCLTTFPLALDLLDRQQVLNTVPIVLLFPFSPPDTDHRRGTVIGIDVRANSIIAYDRYNMPKPTNMNQVVLGTSGGGKSYFIKLGVDRDTQRGILNYIIDPEGEYVSMTEAAGGRVLRPGIPGQGLNPFVISQEEDEKDLLQRLQNLSSLIQLMIRQPLDAEQRADLDDAMVQYYQQSPPDGKSHGFQGFHHMLMTSENNESWQRIGRLLRPFASGTFRHLLSDQGQDLLHDERPITTFDLSEIDDAMRPAAALVCSETVWAAATRNPVRRQLAVDEVWTLMKHEAGGEAMLSMAKRARKHMLGLTVITQDVQDLVSDENGISIVQNAQSVFLFQQTKPALTAIRDTFSLDDRWIEYVSGMSRGSGLLLQEQMVYPIRVESTPGEHEIVEFKKTSSTAGPATNENSVLQAL